MSVACFKTKILEAKIQSFWTGWSHRCESQSHRCCDRWLTAICMFIPNHLPVKMDVWSLYFMFHQPMCYPTRTTNFSLTQSTQKDQATHLPALLARVDPPDISTTVALAPRAPDVPRSWASRSAPAGRRPRGAPWRRRPRHRRQHTWRVNWMDGWTPNDWKTVV